MEQRRVVTYRTDQSRWSRGPLWMAERDSRNGLLGGSARESRGCNKCRLPGGGGGSHVDSGRVFECIEASLGEAVASFLSSGTKRGRLSSLIDGVSSYSACSERMA
jgi:hypothetical protein